MDEMAWNKWMMIGEGVQPSWPCEASWGLKGLSKHTMAIYKVGSYVDWNNVLTVVYM